MDHQIKKFLEFNGKIIYFLNVDGKYYVALKPICEALGLDWRAQHKAILRNKILCRVSSNQTIHDSTNRLQEMTCLPEKYIYGWLFRLNSNAEGFQEFQNACYELLYDYFHGTLAQRISTLGHKTADELEIEELERQIASTDAGQKLSLVKTRMKTYNSTLRKMDIDLQKRQIGIKF